MGERYKALAEKAGLERDSAPNLVNQGASGNPSSPHQQEINLYH